MYQIFRNLDQLLFNKQRSWLPCFEEVPRLLWTKAFVTLEVFVLPQTSLDSQVYSLISMFALLVSALKFTAGSWGTQLMAPRTSHVLSFPKRSLCAEPGINLSYIFKVHLGVEFTPCTGNSNHRMNHDCTMNYAGHIMI